MNLKPVLQTWGRVLIGRVPTLSVEITRECPLRCPGCYAYGERHLGSRGLRDVADFKGQELISKMLELVSEHRPLHLSIVGGEPLLRRRELDVLLPEFCRRGIHVQVVTSAFTRIPHGWASIPRLRISVSVDGLQPDHDRRRTPATYDRILRHIEGQHVALHCTVTSAMTEREGYLAEFLAFWSKNRNVEKIWMSIFTPQIGDEAPECLSASQKERIIKQLLSLRHKFPKLDMSESVVEGFRTPPRSSSRCIFARTTRSFSPDLLTQVRPCQLGGNPDCKRCGCIAAMGLAAVGNYRVVGRLSAGHIFWASTAVGDWVQSIKSSRPNPETLSGGLSDI